jgi:hypothetical protein
MSIRRKSNIMFFTLSVLLSVTSFADPLEEAFRAPSDQYRPETWFHLIGNNITREGLTRDLEALKHSGIRGIQLFNKNGPVYPGVPQVKILTPEWRELIRHAADECQRLGLTFTLQNCPGWSLAGGPWVPAEEAQRELVHTTFRTEGGKPFLAPLTVDKRYQDKDSNYQDIGLIAFPTPIDDSLPPVVPAEIETNNSRVPWSHLFDPDKHLQIKPARRANPKRKYDDPTIGKVDGQDSYVILRFADAVTLRSIQFPPICTMVIDKEYPVVEAGILIETIENGQTKPVAQRGIPVTCWQDRRQNLTLAIPKTTTRALKITFQGRHALAPSFIRLLPRSRLDNWEAKAAAVCRSLELETGMAYPDAACIRKNQVIDLTDRMDATGRLNWTPPAGNWTVARLGHVNMKQKNGPATREATGWECSKLDKTAIENHLRKGMIGDLAKPGGPCGDGKLYGLLIDSWERFVPTWTMHRDLLFREFEQRRGYTMRPWLPAIMGYIVQDAEHTERFLRDLRETMDDLFVENFFAHFQKIGQEAFGAVTYTEGATGEVLPGDPLRYYGVVDVPMTEFWYPGPPSAQNRNGKPVGCAASAAHLYNKRQVAAEACTQFGVQWTEHPFSVKYLIDHNFTLGVNHLVFHTFTHTPQKEVYPGSTFGSGIGFPLVRGQTWWRHTPAWIDYLSRCQYLLQQGEYVADVLWYLGDNLDVPPAQDTPFVEGYRFDHLNAEVLHDRLSVNAGRLHVRDGGDYRLIRLRDSGRMLRSTAERLLELVQAGAVVLGDKPQTSPSLMDDAADRKVLQSIADRLWGNTPSGVQQVGRGKVYWGRPLDEVLTAEGIVADVVVPNAANIAWIHRKVGDADIYFLSNQDPDPVHASLGFRIKGKVPERWDPHTGITRPLSVWQDGAEHTHVALDFAAHGSAIVVFRTAAPDHAWATVRLDGQTVLDSSPGWVYQESGTKIEIIRAEYGILEDPKHCLDVTKILQQEVAGGAVQVSGHNNLASDPIPGTPKKFRLTYAIDGKQQTRTVNERQAITLDTMTQAPGMVTCELTSRGLTAWTSGRITLIDDRGRKQHHQVQALQQVVSGPWSCAFEPGWDTPKQVEMPALRSLTEHTNPAVRHYSGTVTYRRTLPPRQGEGPVMLDLGEVANIAELWCNGHRVGTRWAPPYRFDIGPFLRNTNNQLEVKITNTWRNQLIYDLTRPKAKRKTWTSNPPRSAKWPLTPAGLLGPVVLHMGAEIPVQAEATP